MLRFLNKRTKTEYYDDDENDDDVAKSIEEIESNNRIDGLYTEYDFITPEEETNLINWLEATPWYNGNRNGPHLGKTWGMIVDYKTKRVVMSKDKNNNPIPMPPELDFIIEKTDMLLKKYKLDAKLKPNKPFKINEGNTIKYIKSEKHFLNHHVDDRSMSGPFLINLSLRGACKMSFTRMKTKQVVKIRLPPRTLQIITGDIRYNWTHGIANSDLEDDVRISITLRHQGY